MMPGDGIFSLGELCGGLNPETKSLVGQYIEGIQEERRRVRRLFENNFGLRRRTPSAYQKCLKRTKLQMYQRDLAMKK